MSSDIAKNNLQLRDASLADVGFLASIAQRASTEPFDGSFWDQLTEGTGSTGHDFLVGAVRQDALAWGPMNSWLIAELDGKPVAACAVPIFETLSTHKHPLDLERLDSVAQMLGWSNEVTMKFRQAYTALWQGMDFDHPAHAVVEFLATLPEAEGKGVARRLIAAAADRARRNGHDALGITVILGNDRAYALYASLFESHVRYDAEQFGGEFPGLEKFRMDLSSHS